MASVNTCALTAVPREQLVELLTDSFIDDPAWVSLGHRSSTRRRRVMRLTFAGEVRRARRWAAQSRAAAGDGGDAIGAALAYPSEVWRRPHWSSAFELAALLGGPGAFLRGLQYNAAAERYHPTSPHVYLALLAVTPDRQGQGIGSMLLADVIRASAGLPVYLETAREQNLAFYASFGFSQLGEAALPRAGRLWALRREAD